MSQEDVDEDDTDTVQCLTRKIISTCNKDVQSRVENDENLKITKRTLFFTSWYILSVFTFLILSVSNLRYHNNRYECWEQLTDNRNSIVTALQRFGTFFFLVLFDPDTRIFLDENRYKMATCESCLVYGVSFGT